MDIEKYFSYFSHAGYFLAILFTAIGIPLAMKLVAPNAWYGVRISSTFESADSWYEVNSAAGWALVLAGILSIALVYIIQNYSNFNIVNTSLLTILTPVLLPVIIMTVAIVLTLN